MLNVFGAGLSAGGRQPGTPTIGTVTSSSGAASVPFTAPAYLGKPNTNNIYTATSSPGGITATNTVSPISVTGLTNGTAYTFTVTLSTRDSANNIISTSLNSSASNSVTPVAPPPFFPGFGPFFPFFPGFAPPPPPFFPGFTPPPPPFFPSFCVQGDVLVRTSTGYVKARDLFIGQNLASYKFNELPDNSSVDFAETWVSDTLTGGEVVETTIGAIKARDVATTVMFNGSKQRRFSLEHLMLVRRDNVYAFVQAGVVKMGDYLVYDINDQATDVLVEVVGYVDEVTDVYDITVSPYSLFIAGDLISHNKKGAFQGLTQRDSE